MPPGIVFIITTWFVNAIDNALSNHCSKVQLIRLPAYTRHDVFGITLSFVRFVRPRKPINQSLGVTVFHTQEKRDTPLIFPQKCLRHDAWLGEAYYFWREQVDADDWGVKSKRATGFYEIYTCELNSEDYLDTVFNEEHYYFWLSQLEKIAKTIISLTREKPSLKELNDYIRDRAVWPQVDFIQFQDLPTGSERSLVKPIANQSGRIRTVAFRKRIQIAVYNEKIITNFAFLRSERAI